MKYKMLYGSCQLESHVRKCYQCDEASIEFYQMASKRKSSYLKFSN